MKIAKIAHKLQIDVECVGYVNIVVNIEFLNYKNNINSFLGYRNLKSKKFGICQN